MRIVLLIAALLSVLSGAPLRAQTDATAPTDSAKSSSQTLIEILQDDAAREALIEQLRQTAPGAAEASAEAAETRTVAQQIVAKVTGVVDTAVSVAVRAMEEVGRVRNLAGRLAVSDLTISPAMISLSLVIAAVGAAGLLGKVLLGRVIRRHRMTALTPFRRQVTLIAVYALLRIVTLAVAWAAGYATATLRATGDAGPSATEAIFLTTVLVFGLCRIALRVILTPDAETEPSLSGLHPRAQETIYRTLRSLIAAVIFSFMFLLPLVHEWLGFATVRPVRTLLATILLVMAILALRRIVKVLDIARPSHEGDGHATSEMVSRGVQAAWRSIWPPLSAIYILYCWLIAVTRPNDLSDVVLGGTVYSVAALLLALAGLRAMRGATGFGIRLPDALDRVVPDLARRMSGVLRMLLGFAAVFLLIAAVITAIAAWDVIELDDALSDPVVQQTLWRVVSAVMVATIIALLWAVIASVVDQRLRSATLADNNRTRTLLGLFRNAFTVLVAVLGGMVVLSQVGIDIAPLLAGAGVIGLAIGFGAQKMVQDIITGVFIQLENAINEGDVVEVAGISGGVEKLSIRSVRLRTLDGAVHIVPFSSVDTVTNLTRDFAFHLAEIGVAYKEKLPEVTAAMQAAFETLRAGELGAGIIDDFDLQGIVSLGDSSVNVRGRIKTLPGKQWAIGRAYTALVKEEMDNRGIEIPFPHRQLVLPPDLALALSARPEAGGAEKKV